MIRICGLILLLSASVGVSFTLIGREAKRIRELEGICELIRYIKNNIDSFLMPLEGIFLSFHCDELEKCGFEAEMKAHGLAAAAGADFLSVDGKALGALSAFAGSLGTGFRDDEVKRCEYYLELFGALAVSEKEKAARNRDMYRYLPPLAALSLILVLF